MTEYNTTLKARQNDAEKILSLVGKYMSEEEDSSALKHYGVLGMKWGRRKGKITVSSKKGSSKSNDGTPKKRRMSNKELNARLKRLRMEHEYERLSAAPKKGTMDKVESVVKAIGTVAALTTAATTIYKNLDTLGKAVAKNKN